MKDKIDRYLDLLRKARVSVEDDLYMLENNQVYQRNAPQRILELKELLSEIDKELS